MVSVAFALLVVQACGVVYGDIGTSVLYTLREIFFGAHTYGQVPITRDNVLGAVSLIFWSLLLLITIKYIGFVLYADYHGEGGVFALLGLLQGAKYRGAGVVTGMLLLAAGLLYGDGLITPAISILSAVEGLEYMTAWFQPYVMWIAAGLVLALFAVQRKGTAKVGLWFGWCMVLWLVSIGLCGAVQVWRQPQILLAVNPVYGLTFLATLGWSHSLVVLGFVMLAVTGGEAMYADMGHFGRLPIQVGWLGLAYPCLLLNYCGQGAFLLGHLEGGGALPDKLHVFYATFNAVVPGTGPLILMVSLATMATIIASQALISGAYSLTAQAIALGYGGRMEITHTSTEHAGQIYIRTLNWLLCAGCLVLIFTLSVQLAPGRGLWLGRLRRDALDLPGHDPAGRPALALERAAGQPALRRFCGAGGDVSPGQYPEISGRRVRAPRHWPGPLCGHVQLSLGPHAPAGPGVCRVCHHAETCAGSST